MQPCISKLYGQRVVYSSVYQVIYACQLVLLANLAVCLHESSILRIIILFASKKKVYA